MTAETRPVDHVIAQARAFLGERITTNAAVRDQSRPPASNDAGEVCSR